MYQCGVHRIPGTDITPEELVVGRRGLVLGAMATASLVLPSATVFAQAQVSPIRPPGSYGAGSDELTQFADAAGYNNYLEFSPDKKAVKTLAQSLTTQPWQLTIDGEVEKSLRLDVDSLQTLFGTEERIYRFRCVEGWSMVVPWEGFPLAKLIERARPTSRAKFVRFESLQRSSEMIGQRGGTFPWPYVEGLRMDEAMHPLVLVTTGMYGKPLPKQNGGPIRVVIPWKYGFKSPKAIVRIHLSQDQPETSWTRIASGEYGFYGNVNPAVPHPRWSQARENRLGEVKKRPSLPYNGYESDVASLYRNLDPRTLY